MEIQVTRLVLMVVVVLPQLLQQPGAQMPGIALRINGVGEEEGQFINENGGTAVICLTKRSGSVPGDGLTVDLLLTSPAQAPRAVIDSDYTVTDGGTVHFSPGAADGEERCVTITAICDGVGEENETIVVILPNGQGYETNTTGSEFTGFLLVIIVESADCMSMLQSPQNLRVQNTAELLPTITLEWNAPMLGGEFSYRVTIQELMMSYSVEVEGTTHTITADGTVVLFNMLYNIEVTTINSQKQESSPASIQIEIPANAPSKPIINSTTECFKIYVSWMYGVPSETVFTPVVETVVITYTAQSSGESGIACPSISPTNTSCVFTSPQQDNYSITLTISNIIGTSMASISAKAELSKPLPPNNLTKVSGGPSSTTIIWEPPEEGGVKYILNIVGIDYSREKICSDAKCNYTVTADGEMVIFNTNYTVEVRSVNICGVKSDPNSVSVSIDSDNDDFSTSAESDEMPAWIWILTALIIVAVVTVGVVFIWLCITRSRRKQTGGSVLEMNSSTSQSQEYANSRGPVYAELKVPKKNTHNDEHIYQDPDSIYHQAAESGDLYAMPRKRKNKQKPAENSLYDDTVTVTQKEHPFGLQYAELELPNQTKNPPSIFNDPAYAEIPYSQ